MKIVKFKLLLLVLLNLSYLTNSYKKSEFFLKRAKQNEVFNCKDTIEKKKITVKDNFTFPCDFTQPGAKENAILQNTKSYALLKKPNKAASTLLVEAAKKLYKFYNEMLPLDAINDSSVTRITNGGVYSDNPGVGKEKITKALKNVVDGKGTPKENAGVLAILADLGTAIVLYKIPGKATPNLKLTVETFSKLIGAESTEAMHSRVENVYKERGINVLWPTKSKERDPAKLSEGTSKLRSGIFNLGQPDLRAEYAWETLSSTFFEKCKTEPFTAHYSGTVFVTLIAFDLLLEKEEMFKTTSAIEMSTTLSKDPKESNLVGSEFRVCKAALAAAELLGIGYHSALEVKPVIWMYLGKSKPKTVPVNPAEKECDANSTKDITGIIESCTAKK
jgi:hypothetical protein